MPAMPAPRSLPARASQRRNAHQQDDEPPSRHSTRYGRAPKPTGKPDIVSPKATSSQLTTSPVTRKNTRAASNVTNYANLEAGTVVYGLYEAPIFHVFGLSREFFDGLQKKPKSNDRAELPALNTLFTRTDDDTSEEESDEPPTPPSPHPTTARGRGRGGRGSRGGRGRGGRGRGRGGNRGGKTSAPHTTSPLRTRLSRNAAPMISLAEEDSNQESDGEDAKPSPDPEAATSVDEESENKKDEENDSDGIEHMNQDSFIASKTPPGSPPAALVQSYTDQDMRIPIPVAVPKISLPEKSASQTQTPKEGTLTTLVPARPKMLDPEEDALSESDLPAPWLENVPSPIEAECADRADFLLRKKFKPMVDVQDVIASLTKYPFARRSTESLYALAENTQKILKAWQDEYLILDARTAPHAHPPKKPCNGGRIPINPDVFEDMKEAEIYGYIYDPKKPETGLQDPFRQRPGHEKPGGRELRQRRTRDMLDSAAPSEEEEEDEDGRPTKRQRRATRRFDGSEAGTGANTPKKHNGWGGARKKGVSKYAHSSQPAASATPEPDVHSKRGTRLLHQRIQEMREESAVTSSGDEGSSNANSVDDDEHLAPPAKRGGRGRGRGGRGRGGYGAKGPRKRVFEEDAPMPSAHAPNGPPPALQSMSEGQNQFTLDAPMGAADPPPIVGPHSAETVFQATPQPTGLQDMGTGRPQSAHTPDAYMNTTPLSQYSNPYDDSANNSASGSRKKPRVKSEKRSQSMTIWWAERKARQKEADEKSGTPPKPPTSRSNSGTGRRGGRTPAAGSPGTKPHPEPQHRPMLTYPDPNPHPPPHPPTHQEHQPFHSHPPPPFSAPSPSTAYAPSPASYPPPPSLVMQPSPLAALPTTIPPPPSLPPGPGRTLAPAPLPPQVPMAAYPSPFGPRTAPRPKNNGPPPLAPAPPAPNHISPYSPLGMGGLGQSVRDMPFKVLVPGIPPDTRRESR